MAAIEVITSQEREVKMKKITGESRLYLLHFVILPIFLGSVETRCLGSSAPEILLSVIEIFGNNFEAGELGPSTIVGSAAFNLFIIIAICIYVIPAGEVRRVQHGHVFLGYGNMVDICLHLALSDSVCVQSERSRGVGRCLGSLTFCVFSLLPFIFAYVADTYTGIFGQRILDNTVRTFFARRRSSRRSPTKEKTTAIENGKDDHRMSLIQTNTDADALAFEEHRKQYLEIFKTLRAQHPDAPVAELEKLATERVVSRQKKSRAFYRIQETSQRKKKAEELIEPLVKKCDVAVVEFDPAHYMCLENVGTIKVKVRCNRGSVDPNCTVTVHYRQEIEIAIVDNDIYEEDEQFMVRLSQVRAHSPSQFTPIPVRLGAASTATVLIVDDDHAGAFGFASEKFKVVESAGVFVAEIIRTRGARGEVSIPYKTVDGQAKAGADYEHQEGLIRFDDEQVKYVLSSVHPNKSQIIEAIATSVVTKAACKVVITEDKEFKNFVDRMLTNANTSIMVGTSSWKQQFNEAITIEEGSLDEFSRLLLRAR
ncbi:Calx-beta domain protein, partial [Cooperia oncophora]